MFKPNKASLGYALFLAVNATGVWGGVFPFLPLSIQTPETMFWFFLVEASVFAAAFVASIIGAYLLPVRTKRFLVHAASLPYFLGWACLIGASYARIASFPLVVAGGALLGVGSAGFYMLWQRIFAATRPERGNNDLIVGTIYASIIYLALHAVPVAVTALLVPLVFLPLFALAAVLSRRHINLDQPMFEDVPREHPAVYRRVLADSWRSAVSLGGLGLCTGVMRAAAITDPGIGSTVNIISMLASLAAAAALLVLWKRRGVLVNVPAAYRRVFPLVLLAFFLMPLVPPERVILLAGFLYALHSVAILVMMIQSAQISRDRGINPVFIYGLFGGIMYALHDLGFIAASAANTFLASAPVSSATIALGAVCLLSLLALVGSTPPRPDSTPTDGSSIELVARRQPRGTLPQSLQIGHSEATRPEGAVSSPEDETAPAYTDRVSKQIALVKADYGLSSREAEVAELIARGDTVARIAEQLFVSENTVRTHSKRIYAKLDIHKKQQLRDLVDSYDPSAVS